LNERPPIASSISDSQGNEADEKKPRPSAEAYLGKEQLTPSQGIQISCPTSERNPCVVIGRVVYDRKWKDLIPFAAKQKEADF
jgi:hypothetical protein